VLSRDKNLKIPIVFKNTGKNKIKIKETWEFLRKKTAFGQK